MGGVRCKRVESSWGLWQAQTVSKIMHGTGTCDYDLTVQTTNLPQHFITQKMDILSILYYLIPVAKVFKKMAFFYYKIFQLHNKSDFCLRQK